MKLAPDQVLFLADDPGEVRELTGQLRSGVRAALDDLRAAQRLKIDRRLGVAIVRWQYDPDGNTVEESYFGADGRPAATVRPPSSSVYLPSALPFSST